MINYKKRVAGNLWTYDEQGQVQLSTLPDEVVYANSIGADCYDIMVYKYVIAQIKGGLTDYYANAIARAKALGMKVTMRISEFDYGGPSRRWADFVNSSTYQTEFLSDFEWLLSRYPQLDGIEIEESEGNVIDNPTLTAQWKAFKNSFLTKEKAVVVKYHSVINGTFSWGFNTGSTYPPNLEKLGYDWPYIVANQLVNSVTYQNGQYTLSDYTSRLTQLRTLIGQNIDLQSVTFLTGSGLLDNTPAIIAINGAGACSPRWTAPGCWRQVFFDQVKYVNTNNITVLIFTLLRCKRPASMWPNDTTPGATAGDKLKYIWGVSTGCPTPSFSYTIKEV
jgi:hypothetical protein